jgi:hypothetical protein
MRVSVFVWVISFFVWYGCDCLAERGTVLYAYPIAMYKHAQLLHALVLYQYIYSRELYDIYGDSHDAVPMLMSRYNPAGVVLLPDCSGFSFIDNGRIRIKYFKNRSVTSLEIYEPVYGIELLHWLDERTCYFHALSHGHYAIYTLNLDEILTCILADQDRDYMYPSHVDSTLFFIECSGDARGYYSYNFCKMSLYSSPEYKETLICFGNVPHIMLQMFSSSRGVVVVDKGGDEKSFLFEYVELYEQSGTWQARALFSFSIAKRLLSHGCARVHESLLPFIPREVESRIYFSSLDLEHNCMALYFYDRITGDSHLWVQGQRDLFVPVFLGHVCCYGGAGHLIEFLDKHESKKVAFD